MSTNLNESVSKDPPIKVTGAEENGKEKHVAQGFRPSISAREQLKKTNRTYVFTTNVVALIVGIILGAGVTAIIFTQTSGNKDGVPPTKTLPKTTTAAMQTTTVREIATTTPITTTATKAEITTALQKNCGIKYDGKCFRAIVEDDMLVHFKRSKKLCADAGLQLANIYSKSHYFMIEGYLRSMFPTSGYISAWTGVKMLPKQQQIVLSTGKNVTLRGVLWHEGYPSTDPEYTHLGLDVFRLPTTNNIDKQGLWNYDPSWKGNTAICEGL